MIGKQVHENNILQKIMQTILIIINNTKHRIIFKYYVENRSLDKHRETKARRIQRARLSITISENICFMNSIHRISRRLPTRWKFPPEKLKPFSVSSEILFLSGEGANAFSLFIVVFRWHRCEKISSDRLATKRTLRIQWISKSIQCIYIPKCIRQRRPSENLVTC